MKKIIYLLIVLSPVFLLAKNKTWTCINEKGETVFTIEAISVSEFSNGLARVYKNTLVNNKWMTGYGFIDKTGKVVIECNLKKAQDFHGDVTWVQFKDQDFYSLIDKTGKVIPTKPYKKVGYFYPFQQDITAVFDEEGKMGFIDATGKEIIPCKYVGASYFEDGLVSVCDYNSVKGEYGFIDKTGKVVIPLKFVQAGFANFHNGLARVKKQGKTVLIDKTGATVFSTTKGAIGGHNKGLVLVSTKPNRNGWGWVNFKNELIINPVYEHAENFNDAGYAVVEKNKLKGVIDTTGKVVIELKYEIMYDDIVRDGYFLGMYPNETPKSLYESKKDYYDADLKLVNTENIKHIYQAKGGPLLPFVDSNEKYGYLSRNFEVVINPVYQKAEAFSEGLAWVLQ
jgi:hypothetical protein